MMWLIQAARLALRGGAFARPNWLFWLDFILYPLLAAVLMAADRDNLGWAWSRWAVAGFLGFTLVEYWVHRLPLHGLFYHRSHEPHHTRPAEYVVFPIWYTPLIFSGAWIVLPVAPFTGFVLGYCWYMVWHHLFHHADLNRFPRIVRRYALWHLAHHHDPGCNFGVTLPVWDYLFGTWRAAPPAGGRA
ncbi:sterol desaturase family protein [Bradyrhizobium sp. HKCCYLR1023]|uniref:sterol desaturase family protein n=1 Tax=Bradyrhizobium TaxID=374 RepID=UPI003EBB24EE